MHRNGTTGRPGLPRAARMVGVTASLVALLAACTTAGAGTTTGGSSTSAAAATAGNPSGSSSTPSSSTPSTSIAPKPTVLTTSAVSGINPITPVTVGVQNGTLTSVTMTNAAGKVVTGALSSDGTSWHDSEVLGYGKTYTIKAIGQSASDTSVTKTFGFTTFSPAEQTAPSMDRMGSYAMNSGETYGVAIIPVVHFDEAIPDEKAAQAALSVTSTPAVAGVWSWIDDQDVAYRPETYWPAHTKVTVAANVYGKDLGHGLYGSTDASVSFAVGRKQTTIADDSAPQIDKVRVYNAAGVVLRTMDTSMGKHGGVTVDGNYINFYTLNGTYPVLEHDDPAIMSSASYGLPVADGGYKPFPVPYSTKISVDGIYLHEYNETLYDQEHGIDDSEGCLNLKTSDAVWFYDHSLIGDPVVVHGAKGAPEIQPWEGGYWSIPWTTWLKNSAAS
jgi:lipoprotein-anchoring transpeptidase ErfK/SrfK